MSKTKIYLCDLDGVVNSDNLRHHLYPKTEAARATAMGWSEWHAAHVIEAINDEMIDFLNSEHANGNAVLFCSMRLGLYRETTINALLNAGLAFTPTIWMRSEDDDTPPPASRAACVLDVIHIFGAICQPAEVILIDDSLANVQAIHNSTLITQTASDHGCRVTTVLYPAFKGIE